MTDTPPLIAAALERIGRLLPIAGVTEKTLAKRILNDSNGIARLREGRDISVRRFDEMIASLTEAEGFYYAKAERREASAKARAERQPDPA